MYDGLRGPLEEKALFDPLCHPGSPHPSTAAVHRQSSARPASYPVGEISGMRALFAMV
jgi:hypothetical protein